MTQNILVTGATGYMYVNNTPIPTDTIADQNHSGGSLVADFVSRKTGPIKSATIFAAVRSGDQVQKLAAIGATPILVDLADEQAVRSAVLDNKSTSLPKGSNQTVKLTNGINSQHRHPQRRDHRPKLRAQPHQGPRPAPQGRRRGDVLHPREIPSSSPMTAPPTLVANHPSSRP